MTINEIRNKVFAVLDSRNLKQPARRKNALGHVLNYIAISKYSSNGRIILPQDNKEFKQNYRTHKGNDLSSAESSVINEMYKQYGL